MKIDEFIEKVNRNDRMEAEEVDGVITIYAVFTEPELEQLKRDAPRLAPAIDAIKEPVEKD